MMSLRAARVNAGLTLEDVSKETGISKPTLINYELHPGEIKVKTLRALCNLYKVNVDDIFLS